MNKNRGQVLSLLSINAILYPVMVLWTLLAGLCAVPLFLLWKVLSTWKLERIARLFIWIYGRVWMVLIRPFAPISKKGLEKHKVPHPCVFVVNHLSFFDMYCMAALPRTNFSVVVRAWPFKIFFFMPFMRIARYINSEELAQDVFEQKCRSVLRQGGSLLFFPEGHRSRTGQLGRFYSGAFKVAMENNVPVQPVVICGTDRFLPPGSWMLRPAEIFVTGLDPVLPACFRDKANPHTALRKYVKEQMREVLEEQLSD